MPTRLSPITATLKSPGGSVDLPVKTVVIRFKADWRDAAEDVGEGSN